MPHCLTVKNLPKNNKKKEGGKELEGRNQVKVEKIGKRRKIKKERTKSGTKAKSWKVLSLCPPIRL